MPRAATLGWEDFDVLRSNAGCRVRECTDPVSVSSGRKRDTRFCARHGVRLHTNTFAYVDPIRNFEVFPEYVEHYVLGSSEKAETHRLGHEMSEDAVSWNVMVGLLKAGALREAASWLTGRTMNQQPDLYMWGCRVDLRTERHDFFAPLKQARDLLERGIRRFCTEPDIMLVAPGEMLVCIEAKFGSGNAITRPGEPRDGEKPTSVSGILERYFDRSSERTRASIHRRSVGGKLHSQLFRNVVFASEMSEKRPWHVVNLASRTQAQGRSSKGYSFDDPTPDVQSYLAAPFKNCFSYRTWEGLYDAVVSPDPRLHDVANYMRRKSAHYQRAFMF